MKKSFYLFAVCLSVMLVYAVAAVAEDAATTRYSIWLGGHYTDFSDNPNKVGEYNLGNSQPLPEFQLDLLSTSPGKLLSLTGHYYDDQNINANLRMVIGQRFSLKSQYRSLVHQTGQDLLTSINAKEVGGGKILSHELQDIGADYSYNRHEILNEMSILLSKRNNVRFIAAHRSIIKKGTEQSISSSHCYSCHLESHAVQMDQRTHEVEAGLQADAGQFDIGYMFGYRKFESKAADDMRYFDTASHPIDYTNPGYIAEFGSRAAYDDSTLAVNAYPETEKMSHKVRFKGDVGNGRLSSSFGYAQTENKGTEVKTDAISGAINYTTPLNEKTRLIARAVWVRLTSDDPWAEMPIYREGRSGPDGTHDLDFSGYQYSSIDRFDATVTAEVVTRLTPKWTVNLLGGFRMIDRDDYAVVDDGTKTKRFIGQLKARYRKGLKYNSSIKYRIEKTTDPYISGRGLFEYSMADPSRVRSYSTGVFKFFFYHEREDLRYQTITTEPTIKHDFNWVSNWRPINNVSVSLGARGSYDKNNDLDSLDVEHFAVQPNLAISLTPNPKVAITGGYTFQHNTSRGPVAIALFDG